MKKDWESGFLGFLALAGLWGAAQALPIKTNVTLYYFNTFTNSTEVDRCECGLFGAHSPVVAAQGLVVVANSTSHQACTWNTEFPAAASPWIALIARGNCTFSEKISRAAAKGAVAVVIYNSPRGKEQDNLVD
uniref:PA domain-containing protein n=1 Tax=Salvator merianae TaxID=96440 RepID=A0A8D0KGX0_SALMN